MKRSLSLFAVALALGLTAAAQSQADPTPTIGFQWLNVTPVDIPASQWVDPAHHGAGLQNDPSGGVFFVPETGGPFSINNPLGTQTGAASVILSTSAPPTNPDQIVAPPSGTNYSATIEVTRDYVDAHGHAQTAVADITFNALLTGTMVGSYTDSVTHKTISAVAELTNTIHDISYTLNHGPATDLLGADSVTLALGDASVTVNYVDFAPIEPNQHTPGAISFNITPSAGAVITGGSTPEPSGVVLGCLGLSCLGGVFWRARRRKTAAALKVAA